MYFCALIFFLTIISNHLTIKSNKVCCFTYVCGSPNTPTASLYWIWRDLVIKGDSYFRRPTGCYDIESEVALLVKLGEKGFYPNITH